MEVNHNETKKRRDVRNKCIGHHAKKAEVQEGGSPPP
jgi:hypothetical protein